jgi:hypothetical protein
MELEAETCGLADSYTEYVQLVADRRGENDIDMQRTQ